MKKRMKNNYRFILLLFGIIFFLGGILIPPAEETIDNFTNIELWDESGFATEEYYLISEETAKIILKPLKSDFNYGSFQKKIYGGWEKFQGGEIFFEINPDSKMEVQLSIGEIISGPNQKNKIEYFSQEIQEGVWQEIHFNLNNPSKTIGDLDYNLIKRIRLNFVYGENNKEDQIRILLKSIKIKYFSHFSKILFILASILLAISLSKLNLKDNKKEIFKESICLAFIFFLIQFILLILTGWSPFNMETLSRFTLVGGIINFSINYIKENETN
jgi:hypothetical protein